MATVVKHALAIERFLTSIFMSVGWVIIAYVDVVMGFALLALLLLCWYVIATHQEKPMILTVDMVSKRVGPRWMQIAADGVSVGDHIRTCNGKEFRVESEPMPSAGHGEYEFEASPWKNSK